MEIGLDEGDHCVKFLSHIRKTRIFVVKCPPETAPSQEKELRSFGKDGNGKGYAAKELKMLLRCTCYSELLPPTQWCPLYGAYVFDSLRKIFPGRVMLKPSVEEYYRYLVDNGIVIGKLVSETPKGDGVFWHSNLETVLVDIVVDKLLRHIVPVGEYRNIFTESFSRYLLDEKSMCRYARRRGAEKKFRGFLEQIFPGHGRVENDH